MQRRTERYKLDCDDGRNRAVRRWGITVETEGENEKKQQQQQKEMEGRLATELRGRRKERGGGELLIMDWFSHFFEGLFFLSPSRWMVIAPPALIMCWIGKKTGGKRFYGNWESIALEVDLLLPRFIPHHTSALSLALACAGLHVCTHVTANDRSTNYSDG